MRRSGERLSVAGGYDRDGHLSTEPAAILESRRGLPIGYWKGSGLALMLDLMATAISGGDSTSTISTRTQETGVSQVFIAIDVSLLSGGRFVEEVVDQIVRDFKDVHPSGGVDEIRYPGEGMLAVRRDNLENGIPVDAELWRQVLEM